MNATRSPGLSLLVLSAALTMAACSKKEEEKPAAAGEVALKATRFRPAAGTDLYAALDANRNEFFSRSTRRSRVRAAGPLWG